jgi:hypothetical protein
MGANPKRHHFLPEFYLHGFARDGLLWLYDRQRKQYRPQTPHNTAIISYYYAFENEQGERDCRVEQYLSVVEGKAKATILRLEAGDAITPEERLNLAQFIAFLNVRTPKFHREVTQIADATAKHLMKYQTPTVEAAAGLLREYGRDSGASGITPESMFKFIQNEEFRVEMNRNFVINAMIDQVQKITLNVALMGWMVIHADRRSAFITTDEPIGFIVPDEFRRSGEPALGLGSQTITKIVPLSQSVALLIGRCGGGFGHFGFHREQVRDLNIRVATECEAYVIGRDEALVRTVVKRSKIDTSSPGTHIKVEHIPHPTDPLRTFLVARRVPADAPDEPLEIVINDGQNENGAGPEQGQPEA